jgi:cytoskeletal protein RodZ
MTFLNAKYKINDQNLVEDSSLLLEVGFILKNEREKRALTLKDIKERTCIPVHHILAIENGLRETLPEDLFLIGFLKSYAKALGLNDSSITNMYSRKTKFVKSHNENDDFDLLFDDKGRNDFNLNLPERKEKESFEKEKSFFSIFHFYFFIGVLVFISVFYLVFNIIVNGPYDSKNKTFKQVIVDNEENFEDEEDLNSAVSEYDEDIPESPETANQISQDVLKAGEAVVSNDAEVENEVESDLDLPELVVTPPKNTIKQNQKIVSKPIKTEKPIVIQKPVIAHKPVVAQKIVIAQKPKPQIIAMSSVSSVKPTSSKPAKTFCAVKKQPAPVKVATKPVVKPAIVSKPIAVKPTAKPVVKIEKKPVVETQKVIAKAPEVKKIQAAASTPVQHKAAKPAEIKPIVDDEIMLRPLRVIE